MKIEALAMAVAFAAGTVASPEKMGATSVNAMSYTAQQLSGMSKQEAETICAAKSALCCKFKRDLHTVQDFQRVEGTQRLADAEAASLICKKCRLLGKINCGRPPRPCEEDDDRPGCDPGPDPCEEGDDSPDCDTGPPPPVVDPPPCGPNDNRPMCNPDPDPGPCRPPQCVVDPPPCGPNDKRPMCNPPSCEEGDSSPECSGDGPYPG